MSCHGATPPRPHVAARHPHESGPARPRGEIGGPSSGLRAHSWWLRHNSRGRPSCRRAAGGRGVSTFVSAFGPQGLTGTRAYRMVLSSRGSCAERPPSSELPPCTHLGVTVSQDSIDCLLARLSGLRNELLGWGTPLCRNAKKGYCTRHTTRLDVSVSPLSHPSKYPLINTPQGTRDRGLLSWCVLYTSCFTTLATVATAYRYDSD